MYIVQYWYKETEIHSKYTYLALEEDESAFVYFMRQTLNDIRDELKMQQF